jgi:beta-glucosidase
VWLIAFHVLAGFAKVRLAPGERRIVEIKLGKHAFSLYDVNGDLRQINGTHAIYAGFSQPDARSVALMGMAPLRAEIEI